MGSSMEHNLRTQLPENMIQPIHVPDGSDNNLQVELVAVLADQLLLHIVGIVLVDIQDRQLFRVQGGNLAAQLGADGSAAAGDQHGLPGIKRLGLGVLHLNDIPEQKILNTEITQSAPGCGFFLRTGGVVIQFYSAAGISVTLVYLLLALHR